MRYCFDIDGTICTSVKGRNYEDAEPFRERIDIVNQLYAQGNEITYFTARAMGRFKDLPHEFAQKEAGLALRELTQQQLLKWGCRYHQLIMGKPHADVFVDDKGIAAEKYFWRQGEGVFNGRRLKQPTKEKVFDGALAEQMESLSEDFPKTLQSLSEQMQDELEPITDTVNRKFTPQRGYN